MSLDPRDALSNLIPLTQNVTDSLISNIDSPDQNTTYIGVAVVGTTDDDPSWKITRIVLDGNITKTRFADGSVGFNKRWTERVGYGY